MNFIEILEKIFAKIKKLFLRGFFTLLPIVATIVIIDFIYNLIAKWLFPLKNFEPLYLQKIPGIEFILVTLFILVIGALAKFLIITPIIHHFEKVINKIPFIRTIYSSAKTLVDFFSMRSQKIETKKVVLIEYPNKGFFHLAFLLEEAFDNYQKIIPNKEYTSGKKFYKVFMPHSPNPTGGYFFILSQDMIVNTDITFEEAIKALVSCGLITPESLKNLETKSKNI